MSNDERLEQIRSRARLRGYGADAVADIEALAAWLARAEAERDRLNQAYERQVRYGDEKHFECGHLEARLAALKAALREPTEEMQRAAIDAFMESYFEGRDKRMPHGWLPHDVIAASRAAGRAALEEKP